MADHVMCVLKVNAPYEGEMQGAVDDSFDSVETANEIKRECGDCTPLSP